MPISPTKRKEDFDYIYYPNGGCGICPEQAPGVVLAYDDMQDEGATWFCARCWPDFVDCLWLVIVEDRRHAS